MAINVASFGWLVPLYRGCPHRGQFRARSAEANTCSSHPMHPWSLRHSAPLVALRCLSALRRIELGLRCANMSPSIDFNAVDEQFIFVCKHRSLTATRTGDSMSLDIVLILKIHPGGNAQCTLKTIFFLKYNVLFFKNYPLGACRCGPESSRMTGATPGAVPERFDLYL